MECALCHHPRHETFLDIPQRITANQNNKNNQNNQEKNQAAKFGLTKCENCGFVRIHPVPSEEDLQIHYHADYWTGKKIGQTALLELLFRIRFRGIVAGLKKRLKPGARILDIGAGDGSFVKLLRKKGFNAYGFDPYSVQGDSEFILKGDLDTVTFEKLSFDAVTCFHVLEHLPDPMDSIEKALTFLKPGGWIVVEVPNIGSWGYAMFKRRWQPLQLPGHINHFTTGTLTLAMEKNGAVRRSISHYSPKASKAAIVLSIFPAMNPKAMRLKKKGKYPLPLKLVYLAMQFISFPYVFLSVLARSGCIIRGYFVKR